MVIYLSYSYQTDFIYQKQIYTLQTYKRIIKICIRKNILIIVSQQRILIHNLEKRQNQCYIETINGKIVFLNQNYFQLSIFYPQTANILANKFIWSKKIQKFTNGVKYQKGCYYQNGKKVVLSLENVLSFYEDGELVKVYGFDDKIIDVISCQDPSLVFVLLQNGQILGQNLSQQFIFNFQQIKDNQLLALDQMIQDGKKNEQNKIWMIKSQIFHWKKGQNSKGKLLKADANKGQLKKYVEVCDWSSAFSQGLNTGQAEFNIQRERKQQSIKQQQNPSLQIQTSKQNQL